MNLDHDDDDADDAFPFVEDEDHPSVIVARTIEAHERKQRAADDQRTQRLIALRALYAALEDSAPLFGLGLRLGKLGNEREFAARIVSVDGEPGFKWRAGRGYLHLESDRFGTRKEIDWRKALRITTELVCQATMPPEPDNDD